MDDQSGHIDNENEKPGLENAPGIPSADAKPAGKPLLYTLFSPETRMGRFLRPVLRWVAAIVGLFALGLLAGYMGLYIPAQKANDALRAQLVVKDSQLSSVSKELADLQPLFKKAVVDLNNANLKAALARGLLDLGKVRTALEIKDGAGVLSSLSMLENDLNQLIPLAIDKDAKLADLLQSRLKLIKDELNRDPAAVSTDLGILEKSLLDLDKLTGN